MKYSTASLGLLAALYEYCHSCTESRALSRGLGCFSLNHMLRTTLYLLLLPAKLKTRELSNEMPSALCSPVQNRVMNRGVGRTLCTTLRPCGMPHPEHSSHQCQRHS